MISKCKYLILLLIILDITISKLSFGVEFNDRKQIKFNLDNVTHLIRPIENGSNSNRRMESFEVNVNNTNRPFLNSSPNRIRRHDFEFVNPKPADVTIECVPLKSFRYFTDGFCYTEKGIAGVVCTGSCLPINDLPWYAEYIKVWSNGKKIEHKCLDDQISNKKVKFVCDDGSNRYYRIPVVESCKCVKNSNTAYPHSAHPYPAYPHSAAYRNKPSRRRKRPRDAEETKRLRNDPRLYEVDKKTALRTFAKRKLPVASQGANSLTSNQPTSPSFARTPLYFDKASKISSNRNANLRLELQTKPVGSVKMRHPNKSRSRHYFIGSPEIIHEYAVTTQQKSSFKSNTDFNNDNVLHNLINSNTDENNIFNFFTVGSKIQSNLNLNSNIRPDDANKSSNISRNGMSTELLPMFDANRQFLDSR